jgi:hypothetical protein
MYDDAFYVSLDVCCGTVAFLRHQSGDTFCDTILPYEDEFAHNLLTECEMLEIEDEENGGEPVEGEEGEEEGEDTEAEDEDDDDDWAEDGDDSNEEGEEEEEEDNTLEEVVDSRQNGDDSDDVDGEC